MIGDPIYLSSDESFSTPCSPPPDRYLTANFLDSCDQIDQGMIIQRDEKIYGTKLPHFPLITNLQLPHQLPKRLLPIGHVGHKDPLKDRQTGICLAPTIELCRQLSPIPESTESPPLGLKLTFKRHDPPIS